MASIKNVAEMYAMKVVIARIESEITGPRCTKPCGQVKGPVASRRLMIVAEAYMGVSLI